MHFWKRFFDHFSFILLLNLFNEIIGSEVLRPRGVSLSRAPLYNPKNDFTCFDRSKTIPFSQVNDDYCDCPDASDEPGTSACPHGIFYCVNAGFKPMNLASSRVNDGICDCCDGADEYASEPKCINNCAELGQFAREKELQREELLKAGKQLREEFSQKGIQEKQQRKEKLLELEKNKEEADRVKAEKERLKNEAEELENTALDYYRKLEEEQNKQKAETEALKLRVEANAAFNKYDVDQDGKITVSELQQFETFDKDKDGKVSEEEAKYFLNDQEEADSEKFVSDAWNRIKPYLMIESGAFREKTDPDQEAVEEEEEFNEEEKTEEDADDEEDSVKEQQEPEQQEEIPPPIEYDEETQKLVDAATDARNEFSNAESAVRDLESEIRNIKEYLEKDFGPDEEYAPLLGQCFEYVDHEYIYKLCPFDKTVQQPKSGSMETRLGTWGHWSGPDHNKYERMSYERGQACWNGPQRSTIVNISCGSDNKVTSVSEPNKCEYVFEFSTPAACYEIPIEYQESAHDEL
ncbi:glucosidase 2 subunit beta [Coccinella septempunctata]|uniref:glucosidase 2 subunit beta n=1 Tax=Coccinella septempunctata TaxID=41139 RepID=UPI001D070287|nr:glucosidase 2 subunit beta [Coccinella septempunctata]